MSRMRPSGEPAGDQEPSRSGGGSANKDENDEEIPPIHRRGGGIVDVDGRVLLADLERDLSIVLRPEMKTVETLGGYIIARLEHPAKVGERIECEGLTLVVTDVAGRRVRRVRIVPADGG